MSQMEPPSPTPADPLWARPPVVAAFVVVLVLTKFALAVATDLIRDEAYYTLWALHPLAAGYFDHPPATVWFIKGGFALFGVNEVGARALTILSMIPASVAVWRTAMIVSDDRRTAALSVWWMNLTVGMMLGLLVITPDAPAIAFWTLAVWSAAELLRSGRGHWWLVFGLFAGLGLAAKYTGLFLGAGVVIWLLWHRENRRWFASPWLYAGGALALAIFAPVVVWNLGNGLSSFAFQFGRSAGVQDFNLADLVNLPDYLAGQVALLLPWLFALGTAAFWLFFTRPSWRADRGLSLVVLTTLPALSYFLFHALHSAAQGNWPWPIYPQFALLGAFVAYSTDGGRFIDLWRRHGLRLQAPVGAAVALVIFAQALFQPVRVPFSDQTLAMHGWAEVAQTVQRVANAEGGAPLLVRDYGLYGYLESYRAFEGLTYRALPLDEFHRYGFVTGLPATDEAVQWPVLVAWPGLRDPADLPRQRRDGAAFDPPLTFVAHVPRIAADGEPAGGVTLMRMERQATPVFSGGTP